MDLLFRSIDLGRIELDFAACGTNWCLMLAIMVWVDASAWLTPKEMSNAKKLETAIS